MKNSEKYIYRTSTVCNKASNKIIEAQAAWLGTSPNSSCSRKTTTSSPPGQHHGKFPNFMPRLEMFVFHHGVGRVLDISMGGVTYSYIADSYPPEELSTEGILFTYSGQHVPEIPFEIMGVDVYSRFFSSKYLIMKRMVRFGELSEAQVRQLESFILKHAHIPQLSYDSRYENYKTVYAPAMPPSIESFDNKAREMEADNDECVD